MADMYSFLDARNLLKGKFIFMLGDSNMRATYKDLVMLISRNEILDIRALRKKGEESFEGDRRIQFSGLISGRHYVESREFINHDVHIEFHFITRCINSQIEEFFRRMKSTEMKAPDVIIMNSCIWDISRWGPNGAQTYKQNMQKLMELLDACKPEKTLFLWTTCVPVSTVLRGGLLIKQIDFLQPILRFEVMEANLFCRHLVVSHGYDILDTHYHLRMQIHSYSQNNVFDSRRLKDGLHYGPLPVRFISNLILTHIALSWDVPLPGNAVGIALKRVIECGCRDESSKEPELPAVPSVLDANTGPKNGNAMRGKNQNRVIARGKRHLNYNRGGFNYRPGPIKPRKPQCMPQWLNDGDGQWSNPLPPPPPPMIYPRPKFWPNNSNNLRYSGPPCSQPPWNDSFNDTNNYSHSDYADFDHVGGPMRKNQRFPKNRPMPY